MEVKQKERRIYFSNDGSYRISLPYELREWLKESVEIVEVNKARREILIKY